MRDDVLSREQYELSKQELQKRMLQDLSEDDEAVRATSVNRHGAVVSVVVALAIPLAAIYLYLVIGDTRGLLPQSQLANATQLQGGNGEGMPPDHAEVKAMVDGLAARLKENPDDMEGWVMLGRSYTIMGRFDEASTVYAKLVQMAPDNPGF